MKREGEGGGGGGRGRGRGRRGGREHHSLWPEAPYLRNGCSGTHYCHSLALGLPAQQVGGAPLSHYTTAAS